MDESSRDYNSEPGSFGNNNRMTIESAEQSQFLGAGNSDGGGQEKRNGAKHGLHESDSSMIDLNSKEAPTRKFKVNQPNVVY